MNKSIKVQYSIYFVMRALAFRLCLCMAKMHPHYDGKSTNFFLIFKHFENFFCAYL